MTASAPAMNATKRSTVTSVALRLSPEQQLRDLIEIHIRSGGSSVPRHQAMQIPAVVRSRLERHVGTTVQPFDPEMIMFANPSGIVPLHRFSDFVFVAELEKTEGERRENHPPFRVLCVDVLQFTPTTVCFEFRQGPETLVAGITFKSWGPNNWKGLFLLDPSLPNRLPSIFPNLRHH